MPNPVLIYTAMTTLPLRIVTLLWPVENVHADSPRVEIIPRRNGDPGSLMFPDFGETVLFEDGEPMVERCS